MNLFGVAFISLWILTIIISVAILMLIKKGSKKYLYHQEDGLERGEVFPFPAMKDNTEQEIKIINGSVEATILIYGSVNCDFCKTLYPILDGFQKRKPNISLIVFMEGELDKIKLLQNVIQKVPIIPSNFDEFKLMGVQFMPFAYYLSPDGSVLSKGTVNSEDDIDFLIELGEQQKWKTA